jgi:hypothetical protein
MRMFVRVASLTLAAGLVGLVATPAFAATTRDEPDRQVVITGSIDVRKGEVINRALIFDGNVRVDGRVRDWVFAFNGDVTINGRVDGDVTALNGRVVVTASGSVAGDVVSSDRPAIANRSSVKGDIDRARRRFALGRLGAIGRIVLWILATVSSFLLGAVLLLVAPRGADAAGRAGRTAMGAAIGLGLGVAVGLPLAGVILAVTVVGLPLGLATLFALGLLYGLGYVAGCFFLGRLVIKEPRSRWLAFLVGWAILRGAAVVPLLGGVSLVAATVYGIGCLTVATFRARSAGAPAGGPGAGPVDAVPSAPIAT